MNLPPKMHHRHCVLRTLFDHIRFSGVKFEDFFEYEDEHAGLGLRWIKRDFIKEYFPNLNTDEYQIVLGEIPSGKSDYHVHEVGSSSFIVLGKEEGFSESRETYFISSSIDFTSRSIKNEERTVLTPGGEFDIPANTCHQFENNSNKSYFLFLVTHPIISIEENSYDIFEIDP